MPESRSAAIQSTYHYAGVLSPRQRIDRVMSSDFETALPRYAGDPLVAEVRFAIWPVPSADDLAC